LPTCPWASCRPLRREVPDVTHIEFNVLPRLNGASRLGASSPPSVSFLGTSVPAGPSVFVADALPRVRGKVAVLVPQAQPQAAKTRLGQVNIHNYMTGVPAVGEGASGPPRDRQPV
jgi:hypothetical protein